MYNTNNDYGIYKNSTVKAIHAINRNELFDTDDLFALVITPNWDDEGKTYYYLVWLADENPDAIGHYWGILDPSDLDVTIREWITDAYFGVNPCCFKLPNYLAEKRNDEWDLFYDNLEIHWLNA